MIVIAPGLYPGPTTPGTLSLGGQQPGRVSISPQSLNVPTSSGAASTTFSFQVPLAGLPSKPTAAESGGTSR